MFESFNSKIMLTGIYTESNKSELRYICMPIEGD